jgi:hypothetical protein
MLALMVGGPLHGQVVPMTDGAQQEMFKDDPKGGPPFEYKRRTPILNNGLKMMIFAFGDVSAEQVEQALKRSSLSNTSKLPVLDASFAREKPLDEDPPK